MRCPGLNDDPPYFMILVFGLIGMSPGVARSVEPPPGLQHQLLREEIATLARDARSQGDVNRGALIYYRHDLLCARCHSPADGAVRLGPELGKADKDATDAYLTESILLPSKVIKKGFETVIVATHDGKAIGGQIVKEDDSAIVLGQLGTDVSSVTVAKKEIAERKNNSVSLMPEGQMNVLSSRQEFLDLVRYVLEVAAKGPDAERQLRPSAALIAPPPLPEYEKNLDHAGLIRSLNNESLKRGEAIYMRVCANCHGTREQVGSMPTSLRFAEGKFKNGFDPFRMYQTLTHGFAMMTPQHWMVPEQKYDVIHFIRERYLKPYNPSQYAALDEDFFARLPKGTTRGPKPSKNEPWVTMNYGPSLTATLEVGTKGNFAYKGISIRLDPGPGGISRGRNWMLFDHDTLRMAAAWDGEAFINWRGINFNGAHQVHPQVTGDLCFANPVGPGWANPADGSFDDPRLKGRDGKPYGPLPRAWGQYKGMYHFGNQVVVSYTVGDAPILEMPGYTTTETGEVVYVRTLNVGRSSRELILRVAPEGVSVARTGTATTLTVEQGYTTIKIPAAATPLKMNLYLSKIGADALQKISPSLPGPVDLKSFTQGGPQRWGETIKTSPGIGGNAQPYEIDVLTVPLTNPWNCQMRLTGFDFFADGKAAAVCSWDGDVWRVDGVDAPENGISWRRIASGLFQPLGLKIVQGKIYVACRDQIAILHDLNGDGETDFYECFNNDHQVTEHFHEFAMDLQIDNEGNFYYAKGARHALKAIVPHHGTLLRVSKDGGRTDILATGFRAPNGVCLNSDGTFFLTDQEGFWLPKNRINLVKQGGYYGNFWGYTDVTDPSDDAMELPVCWITNSFDRSPSEMLWVTSDRWGPLRGSLLNFSYGYGKIYVVPHEKTASGRVQGGMNEFPLPQFPTGVMRGRFHDGNGQLYCCGMFAWAGNQSAPGGLYRVRYTGKPVYLPTGIKATKSGVSITFSGSLDPAIASDPKSFAVKTWSLKRSEKYGSNHYDEKSRDVTAAKLAEDGKTVLLDIATMKPTWGMEIKYNLRGADGTPIKSFIHNSIYDMPQ